MTELEKWLRDADVVIGGTHYTEHEALLDPSCWQAVGKTRGWDKRRNREGLGVPVGMVGVDYNDEMLSYGDFRPWWLENMHQFIDALADGKTIEEALGSIA